MSSRTLVQTAAPQLQPQPSAVAPPRSVAAPDPSMQEQEQPPPAAYLAATPSQSAVQPAPPSLSQTGTQLALLPDAKRLYVSRDAEREDDGESSKQVASAVPPLSPVASPPRTAAPLGGGDAARCAADRAYRRPAWHAIGMIFGAHPGRGSNIHSGRTSVGAHAF
ncbi:hypothetical protein T492DRAFT_849936 [Pavlovales sp. CCMP2436]|nr:hypothetical protein T492DRAFT_849936 [Pavlovales sp. CCMP2436]